MIDRRLLVNFDWLLLLASIILCSIGVLLIYSATSGPYTEVKQGLYLKQIYWIFVGLIVMVIVISIDYHHLARWSPVLYIFNLSTLVYVLYTSGSNVKRWIRFFGMNIQPSEFAKFCLILLLAQLFKEKKFRDISMKSFIFAFILTLIPTFMILKQPDVMFLDKIIVGPIAGWAVGAPRYMERLGWSDFMKRPVGTGPFMIEGDKILIVNVSKRF